MLRENQLFGFVDKVKIAIDRIKQFEPKEGYYVAFSGGKDSIVIKELVRMAGVKHDCHFNNTTIEYPDTIKFIKEHHKDVAWENPERPFFSMIESKGYPSRQKRWCCELYKEHGGEGRFVILGVRWEESAKRARRKMVEVCMKDKGKSILNPIIDWTEAEVWEFIKEQKLPYCSMYDKGFKRVGCVCCPMTNKENRIKELAMFPRFKALYLKAFNRLYQAKIARGAEGYKYWKNGEEMFYHWLNEESKDNPDQTIMFE